MEAKDETTKPPPAPIVSQFVIVGLNNIVRNLEMLAQISKHQAKTNEPTQLKVDQDSDQDLDGTMSSTAISKHSTMGGISRFRKGSADRGQHFSVIFTLQSSYIQSSMLYEHLPQLVANASRAHSSRPSTKLLQLRSSFHPRLCAALGLPHVSFIGLVDGAPHSISLLNELQRSVADIEIPWLDEATTLRYIPTKVNIIESVGSGLTKTESTKVVA
jgi:ribonuclease P/MRP protein subunit POP3